MCGGPTSTQEQLQQEEADFYKTQISAYDTAYANFSDISKRLNAIYEPILAAGPGQKGFSTGERNDLTTQAIQGTADEYSKAGKMLSSNIAAQGGGNSTVNITSGGSDELREELAATGAAAASTELLGIDEADYSAGKANYDQAIQGEDFLAQGWNPNAFAGSVNNSAQTANSEANAIAAQQNSIWTSVFGALGGIAGQTLGGAATAGKLFGI